MTKAIVEYLPMSHKLLDRAIPITILTDIDRQSYATIGRLFKLSLAMVGLKVDGRQSPTSDLERKNIAKDIKGQIVLHNTIGPNFLPIPGTFNIALPAHEWSRYPQQWIHSLNAFDEVWVTTRHVQTVLKESGVSVPISFLPPALGIDDPPQKTEWDGDGPTKFFSCGEPHFRKGFHLLMEGFTLAFPNVGEAELYIKTSPGCRWESPREDITIVAENYEREKLLAMYKKFDVYITASLGEGLGLPVAEAVLAKLPVAANLWGGHASILKKGSFWRIYHQEVPQLYCSEPGFYARGQKCAFSSPGVIAKAMRRVAKSTAEQRKTMAQEAQKYIFETYGKKVVIERFNQRFGLLP